MWPRFRGRIPISTSLLPSITITQWKFFTQVITGGFPWKLSDNKSPQVSRTLVSIPADLNNTVVGMAPTLPLISCSPSLFSKPLRTVPNALTTTGTTVTFRFLRIFSFLARSNYYSIFLCSFFLLCDDNLFSGSLKLEFLRAPRQNYLAFVPGG